VAFCIPVGIFSGFPGLGLIFFSSKRRLEPSQVF
jgi:hypothetical protein